MEGRANKFYFLIFLLASFNFASGQPPPPPGEPAPILALNSHFELIIPFVALFGLYVLRNRLKKQNPLAN